MEGIIVQVGSSIAVAILGLIWLLIRKYVKKLMAKMDADAAQMEAIDALLAGMAEQQPIANGIKKASADGKITKEEAKQLEAKALEVAKTLATGPALEVLESWGKEKLSSVVKQLLAKFKRG